MLHTEVHIAVYTWCRLQHNGCPLCLGHRLLTDLAASPEPPCSRWRPGPAHRNHIRDSGASEAASPVRAQAQLPGSWQAPAAGSRGQAAAPQRRRAASTPHPWACLHQHFSHGAAAALLEAAGEGVVLCAHRQAGSGGHHVRHPWPQLNAVQPAGGGGQQKVRVAGEGGAEEAATLPLWGWGRRGSGQPKGWVRRMWVLPSAGPQRRLGKRGAPSLAGTHARSTRTEPRMLRCNAAALDLQVRICCAANDKRAAGHGHLRAARQL